MKDEFEDKMKLADLDGSDDFGNMDDPKPSELTGDKRLDERNDQG